MIHVYPNKIKREEANKAKIHCLHLELWEKNMPTFYLLLYIFNLGLYILVIDSFPTEALQGRTGRAIGLVSDFYWMKLRILCLLTHPYFRLAALINYSYPGGWMGFLYWSGASIAFISKSQCP